MTAWSARHALVLIVAVGAALRVATIGAEDLWFDEYLTGLVIQLPAGEMIDRIAIAEANPPLYFSLAAVWERVFGDGDVALRSLSVIFGIATIPVLYAAARVLGGRRAGLVAAAVTATSPFMVWYSQEARAYALFALLAALSFLCFAHLLRGGGPRWLWLWCCASILALATHYFAVLLIAIEAAWMLAALRRQRAEVALATATVAAAGLGIAPLALGQAGSAAWLEFLDRGDRMLQVPAHFVVGMEVPWQTLAPAAVGLVLAAGVICFVRADRPRRRAALVGIGLAGIGVAVVFAATLAGQDYLNTRNLIALWPPLIVGLAVVLAGGSGARIGLPVVALLCALGAALVIWNALEPRAGRPEWSSEEVRAAVEAPDRDRVIVTPQLAASFGAYLPGSRPLAVGERGHVAEIVVVEPRQVEDYSLGPCWWSAYCGGRALLGSSEPVISAPPQFELVNVTETATARLRRYLAPRPVRLPPTASPAGAFLQAAP